MQTSSWLRPLVRGTSALLALLLLVLLAWAGCNGVDQPAQPTPAPLALAAVPADTPLYRALVGLLAPAGGVKLDTMKGDMLACAPTADCAQRWAQGASQIGPLLAPYAALGERCLAALADLRFAEPLPVLMNPATTLAPHSLAASQCGQWLTLDAIAAALAGRRDQALERLDQGSRFMRALLLGNQSLIGNAVAWTVARRHFQGLSAVLALQPAWAPDLLPLTRPLPDGALAPRRWVAAEAAWQRGVVADLRTQCSQNGPEIGGVFGWMVCGLGLGLLPEATRQEIDARWLARLAAAEAGAAPPAAERRAWGLAFRNTLGLLLLDAADASYAGYFARQADVELQRQTVALAVALVAEQVPPGARAAWLQRQPVAERLRARIGLAPLAREISARPFASDAEPAATARPIRVSLPET